ncbi:unnamed protein product [Camellia sinensis]
MKMAAMVANRAASGERTASLWRLSFNFLRNLSTSSSPPNSTTASATNPIASSEAKKPKRRKKKNLFEVAHFLPNWGVGYHMSKTHWTNVSYEITKINLYKDGRHGKAWGIAYKDGFTNCTSQENKWSSQALLEIHSTPKDNRRKHPKTRSSSSLMSFL